LYPADATDDLIQAAIMQSFRNNDEIKDGFWPICPVEVTCSGGSYFDGLTCECLVDYAITDCSTSQCPFDMYLDPMN